MQPFFTNVRVSAQHLAPQRCCLVIAGSELSFTQGPLGACLFSPQGTRTVHGHGRNRTASATPSIPARLMHGTPRKRRSRACGCWAHCGVEDCFCTTAATCAQVAPRICCEFCVSCPCTAAQLLCSVCPSITQSSPPPPPPGPKGNCAPAAPAHSRVNSGLADHPWLGAAPHTACFRSTLAALSFPRRSAAGPVAGGLGGCRYRSKCYAGNLHTLTKQAILKRRHVHMLCAAIASELVKQIHA